MSLRDRIRGVLGFPVTPFRQDLSLDLDGLARNVDEMARYPFCALVAAGGTGELYSLTPGEVEDVVRVTVQAAAGRMPVVAGTGFNGPLAPKSPGAPKRQARIASWRCPPTTSMGLLKGYRLLPADRLRHRLAAHGLQPRLGGLHARHGGPPGGSRPDPHLLEGRPGRHPQISAHHARGGRPPGMAGRTRR